jgi:hypothetical protein
MNDHELIFVFAIGVSFMVFVLLLFWMVMKE